MKRFLILSIAILLANFIVAQTKIIAHKSHSGSMSHFNPQDYKDSFGLPDFDYLKVIKLSDSCIARIGVYRHKTDTICGAEAIIDIKEIENNTPKPLYFRTEFQGFQNSKTEDSEASPTEKKIFPFHFPNVTPSAGLIILLLSIPLLGFIFKNRLKPLLTSHSCLKRNENQY